MTTTQDPPPITSALDLQKPQHNKTKKRAHRGKRGTGKRNKKPPATAAPGGAWEQLVTAVVSDSPRGSVAFEGTSLLDALQPQAENVDCSETDSETFVVGTSGKWVEESVGTRDELKCEKEEVEDRVSSSIISAPTISMGQATSPTSEESSYPVPTSSSPTPLTELTSKQTHQAISPQISQTAKVNSNNSDFEPVNPSAPQTIWTDIEDKALQNAVKQHGFHKMSQVTAALEGRYSAKECRERWWKMQETWRENELKEARGKEKGKINIFRGTAAG